MTLQKRVYLSIASSRGQTMTEYAMIMVTIAAVLIALVQNAGSIITSLVSKVGPLL
jgi:Flp pilus assembly pilin Flp